MSVVYLVIEQIGSFSNGNVSSLTVPKYVITFHSTQQLAEARASDISSAGNWAYVAMREIDNTNSHLDIAPVE